MTSLETLVLPVTPATPLSVRSSPHTVPPTIVWPPEIPAGETKSVPAAAPETAEPSPFSTPVMLVVVDVVMLFGPVAPVAPVAPAVPLVPLVPFVPAEPVAPVAPAAPVRPVLPVGPVGP